MIKILYVRNLTNFVIDSGLPLCFSSNFANCNQIIKKKTPTRSTILAILPQLTKVANYTGLLSIFFVAGSFSTSVALQVCLMCVVDVVVPLMPNVQQYNLNITKTLHS